MSVKVKKGLIISLLVIVLLIGIMISMLIVAPRDLIELNRELKSIGEDEEGRIIVRFADDAVYYYVSSYQMDSLPQIGDEVVLYVDKNYKNFRYSKIYKMTLSGSVLFDEAQQDIWDREVMAGLVISILTATLITAIIMVVCKKKKEQNTDEKFRIKASYGLLVCGVCFVSLGLSGAIYTIIVSSLGIFSGTIEAGALAFMFFAILGGFIIYVTKTEEFSLLDGVYTYVKPFKKNQSASVNDIYYVQIRGTKKFLNVKLFNEQDKPLLGFLDDGTAFRGGSFIDSLRKHGIPYLHETLIFSYEDIEKNVEKAVKGDNEYRFRITLNGAKYEINFKKNKYSLIKYGAQGCQTVVKTTFAELGENESIDGIVLKRDWGKITKIEKFLNKYDF